MQRESVALTKSFSNSDSHLQINKMVTLDLLYEESDQN